MKLYSVKILRDNVYPKRGVRVLCHTPQEAIALAKERLHIPQDTLVYAKYRVVRGG